MQKELNPELFGEISGRSRVTETLEASKSTKPTPALLEVENKLNDTRLQFHQLSETLAKVVAQVNEFIRTSHAKQERMAQAIQKMETQALLAHDESSTKLSQLSGRLAERKSMDMKLQEMVDRHHNILRSYEVRVQQMQKMLAEKEAMLLSAQSSLNETKMEIARLKRL